MLNVKIIAVGSLKEPYLKAAAAEYVKRLSSYCALSILEIQESRLPGNPSPAQIAAATEEEGRRILAAIPPRATAVALALEGNQLSSEEFAGFIEGLTGPLCLIIGGSHGLSEELKRACSLRLSFSRLTFPHQITRVLLLEALYRGFNIIRGTKYHK